MGNQYVSDEQSEWRGLPYFDVFGRKSHLASREVTLKVIHPYFLLFIGIVTSLLFAMDVHDYRTMMPLSAAAITWIICIFTLVCLYVVILQSSMAISRKFPGFFVVMPLVGVLAMSINTFLTINVASMFMGIEFNPATYWAHLPSNIAIGFLFETIFDFFVREMIRSKMDIKARKLLADDHDTPEQIAIAGQSFAASELYLLSAQDHYIEVKTDGNVDLLRARMGDCLSQLVAVNGISPHRSYWVARNAVLEMQGNANSKFLQLTDGTKIPVARGRIKAVREWLAIL